MPFRIDYDRNPNASTEQKIDSLRDSVQRAMEEMSAENSTAKQVVIVNDGSNSSSGSENLPVASKVNLGCVIVGDNVNVENDGTIWVEDTVMEAISNLRIEEICK